MNSTSLAQFRVASVADLAQIAALADRIWFEAYGNILAPEQIRFMLNQRFEASILRRELRSKDVRYWLVCRNQEPVGYGSMSLRCDGGRLKIQQVYLEARAQGLGLGRGLLDVMLALASERSARSVWLTVNRHNENGIQFYRRYGFGMTGVQVTDIGGGFVMDDFVMEMELVASGDLSQNEGKNE